MAVCLTDRLDGSAAAEGFEARPHFSFYLQKLGVAQAQVSTNLAGRVLQKVEPSERLVLLVGHLCQDAVDDLDSARIVRAIALVQASRKTAPGAH
jgi:hypothetical protein